MLRRNNLLKTLVRGNQSYARTLNYPRPTFAEAATNTLRIRLSRLQNKVRAELKIKSFQYTYLSESSPHLTAAASAGTILFMADGIAQAISPSKNGDTSGWDLRRGFASATFGFVYYGFPCKYFYFLYDRIFGSRRVLTKALVDCFIHAPFVLLPAYYGITCSLNGLSYKEWTGKLKEEWASAAFGTVAFWTPVQIVCFKYVPMHARVLWVCSCSLFHKTWLSWMSNK